MKSTSDPPSGSIPRLPRVRDSASSISASAIAQVLNLAISVTTARLLGPTGRGELAAIMLWPLLFAIVGGLDTTHETMVYLVATKNYAVRAVAATGVWLAGILGLILCVTGILLSPAIFRGYPTETLILGRLFFVWIPLSLIGSVAMSIVLGQLWVRTFNIMRLSIPVVTAITIGLLAVSRTATLSNITFAYLLACSAPVLIGLLLVARSHAFTFRTTRGLVTSALAYAARSHLGSLSGLANERADQAMIALFLAPAQLGLYTVAVSVASPLYTLGSSLAFIALPTIASSKLSEVRSRFLGLFVKVDIYVSAVALIIGLALIPFVLPFVFGLKFADSIRPGQVLLVATAVLGLNRILNSGLKAFNRPFATSMAESVAMVVTIVALVVLLPTLGIIGAAMASLLAYSTSCALMLISLRRLGLPPRQLMLPTRQDLAWLRRRRVSR